MSWALSSGTPHARVVFAICVFIVSFYLLISQEERNLLLRPLMKGGHGHAILSVAFLIIAFLILAATAGWDFNPPQKSHLDKVVTVEGFLDGLDSDFHKESSKLEKKADSEEAKAKSDVGSDPDLSGASASPSTSFCQKYSSDPDGLEEKCSGFTSKDTCTSSDCCGWLFHETSSDPHVVKGQCVAIDENGFPIFKSDESGKLRNMLSLHTSKTGKGKGMLASAKADVSGGYHSMKTDVHDLWEDL